MDDTTSRQQIDELADLYLTEPGQAADAETPSPVEGPAPIKLSPKLEGQAAPPVDPIIEPTSPSIEDDSHPVLRLTEEEVEQQTSIELEVKSKPIENDEPSDKVMQDEPAARAVFEAVLMGNLPGMSGPWLTQYAQLLAQTEGPVILLHVGEDAIDLELVEPRAEAQPAPSQETTTVRIPPMRGDRTGLVGLVDALVRSEQTPARTILVRFDSIGDAQALSRLAAMEDWTLLCGSDNASIAAASQQIRSAVQSEPRLADRNVGIMVMGSDDLAAEQAAQRIASELEHDLAAPAELVGHLKRMQPVQVRDLGSFPDPVALWPKLVGFFDALEVPEPMPTPEPAPALSEPPKPKATAPMPPPPRATTRPAEAATSVPASRPEPMPRFRQAKPKATPTPTPARAPAAPSVAQAPQPKPAASTPTRTAPAPRVLAPQPELDLVALIGQGPAALDNPVALDARLPDQPETQLVVDAQGTVHLLAQHLADHADARAAMMQLIEAGRWVQNHLELIALTQRDHDFVDAEPVLHLLTDRADLTTQIVGKLSGQIRLHLLQQVQLGRESGWFCTPLG
ncbi:MAG: hypothetical protein AAGB26_10390 [Planctomycetota bacterium]